MCKASRMTYNLYYAYKTSKVHSTSTTWLRIFEKIVCFILFCLSLGYDYENTKYALIHCVGKLLCLLKYSQNPLSVKYNKTLSLESLCKCVTWCNNSCNT